MSSSAARKYRRMRMRKVRQHGADVGNKKPSMEVVKQSDGVKLWPLWVFKFDGMWWRIGRMELPVKTSNIMVTQEIEPKLVVSDTEGGLHLYDALKLTLDRTIEDPGPGAGLIQDL